MTGPISVRFLRCVAFCLVLLYGCMATHFRGGIIMWKPTGVHNQVEISFRISWRKTYSSRTQCDKNVIAAGSYIGPSGENMRCFVGCSGTMTSMDYKCTDFSVGEDWSAGEKTYTYTFPNTTNNYYQFGFTGGDWIALVTGGGSWEMRTTANLTRRLDTGTVNSSPNSAMPPIVRVQHGCNTTIEIPVNDADGDEVRCRWAESSKQECADVCHAFPGAVLDERTCKISYSATGTIGWYAIAVQIEDFAETTDDEPLSSIPLQFLVNVFDANIPCTSKPEFVPPTRVDTSCVGVPFNTTFLEPLIAKSGDESVSITEINTVSPVGVTKSDLTPYPGSNTMWYVNISWTPTDSQAGSNIFCFSAVDSASLSSDQSCITLLGGVTPPAHVSGSQSPVGDILPTHSEWSLDFDMQFVQPQRPTYMYFYKAGGTLAHKVDVATVKGYPQGSLSRTITIDPKFTFTEKEYYYVLLDPGVARGTTYCGAESPAIRDTTFWTVRIRDITPPRLQFLMNPTVTNANTTISWSFNEEVTTKCTLQTPSSVSVPLCNNTWSGFDLSEGYYTLFVQGTDLEHNAAEPVRHTWRVDRTPPVLELSDTPKSISNKTSFMFRFRCNEECTTECRFYRKGNLASFSGCAGGSSRYTKSFNTGNLVSDASYVFEVKPVDIVGNEGEIKTFEWQTDFVEPVLPALSAVTVVCGADYSPNVTGFPSVTDNLDTTPVVMYGDKASGECGVLRVWNATDDAGNTAYTSQEILFTSPQPANVQFPKDSVVPCGDLMKETTVSMLPAVKVVHPCGLPVNISYTDPDDAGRCGVTFTRHWSVTDDCGGHVTHAQQIRILELQVPDTPQNGQTNIDLQYTLRWPVYPGSVSYQVFLWNFDEKRPSKPTAVTSDPFYAISAPLRPGTQFLWQIEYILGTNETLPSPQWGFETRKFPDLAVETITVPPIAYSGQTFEVRWTVRNVGNLTTQASSWYDAVYISFTDDFGQARRAATVYQRNILFPDDGYTGEATVPLRENDIGQLYVFVQTDLYRSSSDIDTSNNVLKASDIVEAKLTPPPDLRVDMVVIPSSSYSGSEITVSYTVTNHGKGVTATNSWYDRILWSTDQFYNSSDTMLKQVHRNGGLIQDESYQVQVTVVIPREIFGKFYIIVRTDVNNDVFEHTAEDNNIGVSSEITVILSPPPDLRAVSLEVGNAFTTGESILISWLVDNDGETPYKQTWLDRLTLHSFDGIISEVIHISTFSGKLAYGETYSNSFTYLVGPHLPEGQYNLTLHVDYRQDIFEFDKKDNNAKNKVITIYQALPDLDAKTLTAVVSSTPAGNDLQVNWTVVNIGPGRTLKKSWRDVVYVRSDGGSAFQELIYNWNVELDQVVGVNNTYDATLRVKLPVSVYGNILVRIYVDKYASTADKNRLNNEKQVGGIVVPLRTYDLELIKIEKVGTGEIYSGSTMIVKWNVSNSGVPIADGITWEEQLVLSPSSSTLIPRLAFDEIRRGGPLNTSGSYETNSSFLIPDTIVGEMFLHVIIDPNNKVFEGPNKANNKKFIVLPIQSPPSPDFTVTSVTASVLSTTSVERKILSVSWTVMNIGNSMKIERKWKDSVFASDRNDIKQVADNRNIIILESFDMSASLQTQQSYKMSKNILLNQNLIGDFYIYVMTDSNERILELNGEDNNLAHTEQPVNIPPPPAAKLSIAINAFGLENTTSIVSGRESWIEFTVTNIGDIATTTTSWEDMVYLINIANADKETVMQNGVKLATVGHLGTLEKSKTYTVNASITFPYDYSGDAILYVFPGSGVGDTGDSGKGTFASSTKLTVELGKRPNLIPILDSTVSEQNGGEPYLLEYNVTNVGEEVSVGSRYDTVYLSDDVILDPFDKRLETKLVTSSLEPNGSTVSSLSVFLPFDLESKNYILILVIDIRNDIYESNEEDNTAWKALNIRERVSTDIAVVDVLAPSEASFGDSMEINWKIRNMGQRQAKGYKCDTAYISEDREWDINDEQFGSTICGYITIDPYTNVADDKTARIFATIPLVADDSYTAIVKSRSNILDNYLDNNVGISNKTTHISITKLDLESSQSFLLQRNGEKAYRIPDVPAEETLIIKVKSNNQDNFNDLRIRFNKPATRYDFDVSTSDPFLPNQFLVSPNTRYGDYYVLVGYTGSTLTSSTASQLTIEAKLAKFEILKTSPSKAAPLGLVTLKFEGTLLPEDVMAKLSNSNKELHAAEIFRFSSTLVWATFDLKEASVGEIYSASLFSVYLNLTTSLSGVLEIIAGSPGRAKASLSLPAALRPAERGFVYVDIQNEGDTDMMVPLVAVSTNAVGHLKFITNLKATSYQKRHVMLASPVEGPAGILPPKSYSRLIFDAKQIDIDVIGRVLISVTIIEPAETTEHDYIKLKDTLRFSHYNKPTWDKIWNNFIANVGLSWHSMNKKVSNVANQQSLANRRVHELSDFVAFLLDMSDGPKGDSYITKVTDLILESTESPHVTLELTRYVSPKTGLRSMNGILGKGWVIPQLDTKLLDISPEIVKLRLDQIDFIFISSGFGVYENNALGKMVLRNSGCYYIDKKSGKEYQYNITRGELLSISSDRDGTFVRLHYDAKQRADYITHSSGAYIDIAYDDNDRIITASLKNSTNMEQSVMYEYHPVNNLLISTIKNGETTAYEFYQSEYIKSSTFPDGRKEEYKYTIEGFMKSKTVSENGKTLAEMQFTYDGNAKVTREINPGDISVTSTFNELGHVAAAHRKGSLKETFTNTLDTRSIYEGDTVVSFERYDKARNSVYLEDGNGDSLEVEYDKLGQVKVMKDGGGNTYSLERNRNGTLRKSVFPDKSEELYKYRPDGYDVVTRNGVTKRFNYDNVGRVVWKDIGNVDVTTYQFDNNGNMIAASNKIGTVAFTYDEYSALQSIRYPNNASLHYQFTNKGLKSGINSSLGYSVKYSYNDMGLLTEVRDLKSGDLLMEADYYSSGKIKSKRLGNGAYTTYFYQIDSGLLKAQYNYYPNDTMSSKFEYGYNVRERRISLKTLEGEWKFRYDTAGQVTYIKRPDGHQTQYSYDERKNRKSVTINGVTKLYKANKLNQYTEFDDDQTFMHDQNGNLIQVTGTRSREFKFDEDNKLIEFRTPDADCIFMYDGLDSLHQKRCKGETTDYLVDPYGKNGPDILAEIDAAGVNTFYYHGGDQLGLVAMKKGDDIYYYQFDPLGSVVSLLSKDGGLLNAYKSDPFGEIINSIEVISNPFKFVGQWGVMSFSEAPELFYMRARYYDAQHGRFLSADPLGIAGRSKNFYTYAFNNPVHFNDPKGTIAPWVAAGLINTVVYAGFQLATGGDITVGGVASSFVMGALGGAAGQRLTQLTSGITSTAARYFANVNLAVSFNTLNSMVGALTDHIGNNIFGDKPFNGQAFGGSLLNGLVQSFVPGNWNPYVTSALGNLGNWMLDPSKSLSEKWQDVKDAWKDRADWVKDKYDKGKEMVQDAWEKTKDTAEKKWDDFKDYVDDLKDKVGDKWEDVKEDLKNKLDDAKDSLKENWENIKDEVSDQWENIKDEAKEKWDDVKDKIDDTWENLKDEVSDRWDDLKDDAKETFDDFKDKIKDKWEETKDKISDTVDEAMKDLSDAYDDVKDKVNDLKDDLKDTFDDLVDDAKDAWEDFKDDMKDMANDVMDWIRSRDPNDIIGPVGYGAARFISKSVRMNYKIRFENDPNATAPAQRVFIEHTFDSDLNPRTFRIGTFGFGNYTYELEMDRSFLQKTINLTENFGIFLRVLGGLDIVNGRATWEFQSIDPSTGSPPADPRIGFLPPNNGTTGQGFVTFSILPAKTAPSLARIDATATIYFDQNEPIETPPIFNTIDDSAPGVNATVVNDTLSTGSLTLALNSYDIGAGLKDVDILIKEVVGYTMLVSAVNESAVTLPLAPGGSYDLVFSPVDHVGNRDELESSILTNSFHVEFPEIEVSCFGVNNCSGHGNCTGVDICMCDNGFYAADCSSNIPPSEPPVLELMSPGGLEDELIQLYVLAKLVNGSTPNSLSVTLDGFPDGTSFSHGMFLNSQLTVQPAEFGNINASFPEDFAGNVSISARALYTAGSTTVERTGDFTIVILPVFDTFDLTARAACYDETGNSDVIELDIGVTLNDKDNSETVTVTVEVPPIYTLDKGQLISNGLYLLNQTDVTRTIMIMAPRNHAFVPFMVKVTAEVTDVVKPDLSLARSVESYVERCQDVTSSPVPSSRSSTPASRTTTPTESEPGQTDEVSRQTVIIVVCSIAGVIVLIAVVALVVKLVMARRAGSGINRLDDQEFKDTPF